MALKPDFKFSDIPQVQTEGARRAVLMFGEDWRITCMPGADPDGESAIVHDNTMLSFDCIKFRAWTDGKRHNLSDGSPAVVKFFASGARSHVGHYRDGRLQDSEDGSPAQVDYNENGTISGGFSSGLNKNLSADETVAALKAAHVRRVEAAIAKVDQSVIPAGMRSPEDYIAEQVAKTAK